MKVITRNDISRALSAAVSIRDELNVMVQSNIGLSEYSRQRLVHFADMANDIALNLSNKRLPHE